MDCKCILKSLCKCAKRRVVTIEPAPKPEPAHVPESDPAPRKEKRTTPFERDRHPDVLVKNATGLTGTNAKAYREAALSMPAPYGRNKDGTPARKRGRPRHDPLGTSLEPFGGGGNKEREMIGPDEGPVKMGPKPIPWVARAREEIVTDVTPLKHRHTTKYPEKQLAHRDPDAVWHKRLGTLVEPEPSPEERFWSTLGDAASDPESLAEILRQMDIELAIAQFSEFCKQAWHVIEPATELVWGWHHDLICNVLQGLFETWYRAVNSNGTLLTPIKNCVINCPPGSLKSKLVAVLFPVWVWLRAPGTKLICISINDTAAQRDARAARDLIKSNWFQTQFAPQWTLKDDQDAISNYGNSAGGERLSKPSGSKVIGLRGDFLLGDDLNDPEESKNANERDKINSLWDNNIYTRVNDMLRSVRITVQQRLDVDDHSGHVTSTQGLWSPEKPDGWLNFVLSAEHDSQRRFVMPEPLTQALRDAGLDTSKMVLADPRTVEGESIDPVRMPKSQLDAERARFAGTNHYAAQYLQRPAHAEGTLIKRDYWSWFRLDRGIRDEVDAQDTSWPRPSLCNEGAAEVIGEKRYIAGEWDFDWVVISLDPALKETKRGSNWGLLCVAGRGRKRYVLDDRTQRGDILTIIEVIKDMVRVWRPDKILVEDKAAGDEMRRRLLEQMSGPGMPPVALEMIKVGAAGKEERLDACLPLIANGMVALRDGAPWLETFIEEHSLFPNGGKNDDRVDALVQVLNGIKDEDGYTWPSM